MGALDDLPLLQRHRITVDEYYLMAEVGVIAPDARCELIDGEIIDMAPQKSRHARVVNELTTRLHDAVARRAFITCQTPLRLSDRSEPEPDIMLLRPRADGYRDAHPSAADVLLLIEVADSSARYDRVIKLPLYARHGVSAVWIVDLDAGMFRFHAGPAGDEYARITSTPQAGQTLLPGVDGHAVDLEDLLD